MQRINLPRRRFLRGVGGIMVGLPALDIFEGRALAAGLELEQWYTDADELFALSVARPR